MCRRLAHLRGSSLGLQHHGHIELREPPFTHVCGHLSNIGGSGVGLPGKPAQFACVQVPPWRAHARVATTAAETRVCLAVLMDEMLLRESPEDGVATADHFVGGMMTWPV